jgi:hypothetical protein
LDSRRRFCLAVSFVGALAALLACGCAVHVRYEKGPQLDTERRLLASEVSYRLASRQETTDGRPVLVVWVEAEGTYVEERRPLYGRVEVYLTRSLTFRPAFFLWPANLVRTPVGLLGCGFSGVSLGAHMLAAGVGAVVALPGTHYLSRAAGGTTETDAMRIAGTIVGLCTLVLETPLLVLDIPHCLVHGTPLYPVTRSHSAFPDAWGRAIASSWRFAWDYRAYPAFFLGWEFRTRRRDVPGTVEGEWERTAVRDCRPVLDTPEFVLEGPGWQRTVAAAQGEARVDLRELARETGARLVLRFRAEAQAPQGSVSRDFSFQVWQLEARALPY